jgi:hypothetical protein
MTFRLLPLLVVLLGVGRPNRPAIWSSYTLIFKNDISNNIANKQRADEWYVPRCLAEQGLVICIKVSNLYSGHWLKCAWTINSEPHILSNLRTVAVIFFGKTPSFVFQVVF